MLTTEFPILDRWTGAVRLVAEITCSEDTPQSARLGQAIWWARRRGADLTGVRLQGADLSAARLRSTALREVDLRRAILRGADLSDADLRDADLSGSDLEKADLSGAVLRGAALCDTDLRGAELYGADFSGADLSRAILGLVPVVPALDASILAAIEAGGGLETSAWHTCETTHCRAGWAIRLAGSAGEALEEALGAAVAGTLIYAASRPRMPIPDFYASNADALADLRMAAKRLA